MSSINMSSILAKAKRHINTPEMQKKIEDAVDRAVLSGRYGVRGKTITIYGLRSAADKFIEVLQNEIKSHEASDWSNELANGGLGKTAIDSLTKLSHGAPIKIGKNRYKIGVWFTDNLHRESLAPDKYDGVDNIAALLNSGYSAGHTVYGVWRGHGEEERYSLVSRSGAHFIENAIRNYMDGYASEYGVIDIEINDVYK